MRINWPRIDWPILKTALCFWQTLPWLLRSRYPELPLREPDAIVLVGAANRTDGRTSPQGEAIVERARAYLAGLPPHHQLPLVLCVSGNRFGGQTEAQALAAEVNAKIGQRLSVVTAVLDPLPPLIADRLRNLRESKQLQPLLEPRSLTKNTWENVQRVLDYCRMYKLKRILLICHPIHGTWALPLMRHSATIVGYQMEVGLLSSKQRRYDRQSPQWRWRSAFHFYAYAVLAKGKQVLNGWCVLPYIRTRYRA